MHDIAGPVIIIGPARGNTGGVPIEGDPKVTSGHKTKMAERAPADRYIVIQWNDYRKEHFLAFLGGFSSLTKATEVQMKCFKEFQEKGWIRQSPLALSRPIRERNIRKGGTNLIKRKFIECGFEDESQRFTVDIFKIKPQISEPGVSGAVPEEVYIATLWGCWGGLNSVFVGENIPETEPSQRLETVNIDLVNPREEPTHKSEHPNMRYDYEKYTQHTYHIKYMPEVEYPVLCW